MPKLPKGGETISEPTNGRSIGKPTPKFKTKATDKPKPSSPKPPNTSKSSKASGVLAPETDDPFERLRQMQWGLSSEKAGELLEVMCDMVTGELAEFVKIKAFQAILEARKIDLAALKLLIDKKAVDNGLGVPSGSLIPLASLDLSLQERVAMLDKAEAEAKHNRLRIAGT